MNGKKSWSVICLVFNLHENNLLVSIENVIYKLNGRASFVSLTLLFSATFNLYLHFCNKLIHFMFFSLGNDGVIKHKLTVSKQMIRYTYGIETLNTSHRRNNKHTYNNREEKRKKTNICTGDMRFSYKIIILFLRDHFNCYSLQR